jgi:hypothetical protein
MMQGAGIRTGPVKPLTECRNLAEVRLLPWVIDGLNWRTQIHKSLISMTAIDLRH